MYQPRIIFALAVSFLTDFLNTFIGVLTGGAVVATNAGETLQLPTTMPTRYMVLAAAVFGLTAALRGLQKNISAPITATAAQPPDA